VSELLGPVIAGAFSVAAALVSSSVWAPGFWLKRTIAETSSALATTPDDSVAHKALLTALNLSSARLTASLLVPLKLGWFLFAWIASGAAWLYGYLLRNDMLATLSLIGFYLLYAVGLAYLFYVFRLRARQVAAMLANRASGFLPLHAGEIRARAVVTQRLVDRDLSIGATTRMIKQRLGRISRNPILTVPTAE
jgi:hypothetical protein